MFTLTWITEKELARRISLEEAHYKFHSGGKKMRNAAGQVKMSGSEKVKANMNTGNKIFGKHIRKFLHKNNV